MSRQSTISRFFKPVKKEETIQISSSLSESKDKAGGSRDTSICLDDSSDDDIIISNTEVTSSTTTKPQEPDKQMELAQLEQPEQIQITTELGNSQNIPDISRFSFKRRLSEVSKLTAPPTDNIGNDSTFDRRLSKIMKKRKTVFGKSNILDDDLSDDETADGNSDIKRPTKKGSAKLTPLDQQVQKLKLDNMDKILVVRVGYKYKCFAQDAVVASKILQIKLIPGKMTIDGSLDSDANYKQFAYCSFPDVRLDVHLQRLVYHNLKVAVVEQSETTAIKKNSSNKSSVFEREISNTFSKATYAVNHSFGKKSNGNNILGDNKSIWGLTISSPTKKTIEYFVVSINLSSGAIITDSFADNFRSTDKLATRMKYLEPSECVILSSEELPKEILKVFNEYECNVSCRTETDFNLGGAFDKTEEDKLNMLFKNLSSNFTINSTLENTVKLLASYLKQYNVQECMFFATNYKSFLSSVYMTLDHNTIECLDISSNLGGKGSLFWILDHTRTSFGSRKLRNWILHPLVNRHDLEERYDAIECIRETVSDIFFDSLNNILSKVPDLLNTLNRISYGNTSRKEVYFFLKQLVVIRDHFQLHNEYIKREILNTSGKIHNKTGLLVRIFQKLDDCFKNVQLPTLFSMINISAVLDKDSTKQITEFFNLNNYDNPDKIVDIHRQIEGIKTELDENLVTIRKILKRPYLEYKNDSEYLIEIRNSQVKNVPSDWVKVNSTKVVSRFWTPSTSSLVERLNYSKEILINECNTEYSRYLGKINEEYAGLKMMVESLAEYDCILSLAATSCNANYCRPTFSEIGSNHSQKISIKQGRNPIIESLDVQYVPNDVNMSQDEGKVNIITGPNMGGKSSYIRQVALLIIMAQIGSYVPATSMELTMFDHILTRIGAQDNILDGRSTFRMEMEDVLRCISQSTPRSLLLLDEVGRGTGSIDGKAISYALLRYLVEENTNCPLVLFTTHFPELCKAIDSPLLKNYFMDFVEEYKENETWPSVTFLYVLKPGVSSDSYGLNVAKLANIPKTILHSAYEKSNQLKMNEKDETALLDIPLKIKRLLEYIQKGDTYSTELFISLYSDLLNSVS